MRGAMRGILRMVAPAAIIVLVLAACEIHVYGPAPPEPADLSIELVWSNSDVNLDLYLTYPDPDGSSVDSGEVPRYFGIQDAYDAPSVGNPGFFPEDGSANRARVHAGNRRSADENVVFEAPRSRTEIIRVYDIPFEYGTLVDPDDFETDPSNANALPTGRWYAWVGVMEVYVYGRSGTVSDAGSPTVNIYDNDNTRIASFPIDEKTHIKGLSVARIPVFRTDDNKNYYQILLHKSLVNSTDQIRSVSPDSDYYVVNMEADNGK